VVNLARSHFRRKKVEQSHAHHEAPDHALAAPDVEERDQLLHALRALRPEVRAAVVLRYYEDLTEAQTAEVLGCAVGTVKSMLSRAKDRLRVELSER
jgi:RNA polymerase sigma factor (sigma-70 family)